MEQRTLQMRLAVPTVLLYGVGYPLGSATVAVMSPFLVILLRFAASALLLWVIVLVRGLRLPSRRLIGHAVVAGVLTQGVQFLGLYWALAHGVPSGLGSLIISLNPVVTAALMSLLMGHRETRAGLISLALGAGAVVFACAPRLLADHSMGAGVLAVVVAMLGLSVGGIYQGRHCTQMDPWMVTAIGLTASTPFAGVATLLTPVHCDNWPRALGLLAVMVVLSSVGATTLYAACIRRSGARAASILFAVIPAAASVMAWIGLGEDLSAFTLIGLALGSAACLLQSRSAAPQPNRVDRGARSESSAR
ncbi:DMT family transporter [Gordonia sp. SL306]|uniref:DMT family transporter n=1 Tax=Gordonia sp. SL306 TaxID=2995145 RepID=UPI00226FA7D0|nr:DMT family transporter [Gordonia sp. SL306]WAC56942.1 DMT family transporter [Gordonia sp. SL306]